MKSVLCKICILVGFGVFALADQSVFAADIVTPFDKAFTDELETLSIPGGAYAIVENGKVKALRGFGVRAEGSALKVNDKTVFRLASVSKTFAGELAAILVADQKFSLDDKVKKFVPDFRIGRSNHADKIEVGHLLSHSVGLLPNAYDNYLEEGWELDKILSRFNRLKPVCKVGECYGYQNIVFSLIEPVIEKTTGEEYEILMEKHIFSPLEMRNASVGIEGFMATANRAEPHVRVRGGWRRTTVKPDYYRVAPAAGVNASISDMAIWLLAQMGERPDALSPEIIQTVTEKRVRTRRELRKRQWRNVLSDAHYGLGWRIYGFGDDDIVFHSGGVSGYRANISYSPEKKVGIVMLLNAETRAVNELAQTFWRLALKDESVGGKAIQAAR